MDPLLDPQMAEWLRQKQEALGEAMAADKKGQEDADRRALLMQFAQSYVNRRPTSVEPRQVNDARQRFGAETGLEDKARGYGMEAARFGASIAERQAAREAAAAEKEEARRARAAERDEDRTWRSSERAEERAWREQQAARAAEQDREKAERAKAEGATKAGGDLRKEYLGNPMVRRTQEMAEANEKIQHTSPTGPGDISLLVAYMKMVDPGSTVRENEFATAENAGGVSAKVRNIYNKVKEGDKLPPQMREEFRAESRQMFSSQRVQHERLASEYRRLAKQSGLRPEDVVIDLFAPSEAPSPAAAPGVSPEGPPEPGAVKSKSGRWMKKNAAGQWEYL